MIKLKKYWLLLILGIILGFTAGMITFSSSASGKSDPVQASTENPQQASTAPQTRSILNQLSEAFENAASKVSSSVVSIFAEQVVQVQSPFGMPDDSLRDFFGDDFFKRFLPEVSRFPSISDRSSS